jgi:hypothetical protein
MAAALAGAIRAAQQQSRVSPAARTTRLSEPHEHEEHGDLCLTTSTPRQLVPGNGRLILALIAGIPVTVIPAASWLWYFVVHG